MAKTKTGSAKKFGPRYGRTLKEKYSRIDSLQKRNYPCPVCNYKKVKRENLGIWKCQKCNAKFASKAYTVSKVSTRTEQTEEDTQEIQIEEQSLDVESEVKEEKTQSSKAASAGKGEPKGK
ncbi:hypothetical protein GOV08_00270 [Candidatus Woesearchaeota archaeon]|nr:hypothetical protein [Candidatus Woesearchaeota archaeon]